MIDCHVHLADQQFVADLDDVVQQAKRTGVAACLVVTENAEEFPRALELTRQFPDFALPCLGVHPVQGFAGQQRSVTMTDLDQALPYMERYKNEIIAVGEIGLDFTPRICSNDEEKFVQREVFKRQIQFAMDNDLAVNVHSRSAGRPTINLLREMGVKRALLHAFDGKPSVAMEGVQLGYYFSIPPCIARSEQKQKLVDKIPLENLLLETDSPALGPEKQERNVPSNLLISCEFIAKIKNIDIDIVKKVTVENSLKLFPKLKGFIRVL